MTLAFSEEEFAARIAKVTAELRRRDLHALVVTEPENICYLCGFWTPGYHVFQALVVSRDKDPFLVVRNIETDRVESTSAVQKAYTIANLDHSLRTFAEAVRAEGVDTGRIGLEVDGAKNTMVRADLLAEMLPGATFVPSLGLVETFRAVKSEREIDYMREAVSMAESALRAGARSLARVSTDGEVAGAVLADLAAAGSEFTGSPPYVVEGVASARTHTLHAKRPIGPDGHVWMEISASVNRYHGVASRIAGRKIRPEAVRYFEASAAALSAMISAMRDGATSGDVDAAGRAAAERHQAGQYWKNRAAYSLGLSFPPGLGEGHIIDIKPNDPRVLRTGMAFHMIPIMKVPGVGAIGCTDTVVVTPEGGQRLGTLPFAPLGADA